MIPIGSSDGAISDLQTISAKSRITAPMSMDLDLDLPGYHCYYNYAEKKGYSGTAVFSKKEPLSVFHGKDNEGRICALEFDDFYVVDAP